MNKKFLRALLYSALSAVALFYLIKYGYNNFLDSEWEYIDELSKTYDDREECLIELRKEEEFQPCREICEDRVEYLCRDAFPKSLRDE